jgi:4-hydroxy-tetrahydrodipicolinate reductase
MTEETIRVAVSGAAGRMGREVVRAVAEADGMTLVAAVDYQEEGRDAGALAGIPHLGISIVADLDEALRQSQPHVMVDFTVPDGVMGNLRLALAYGVSPVVGTTGLSPDDLEQIDRTAREKGIGAFVAPNFAIGAVLLMEFAAQAARYMPDVEIIELHHEKKLDSPSGTALLTAKKIAEARREAQAAPQPTPSGTVEKAKGARGARDEATGDVPVHSVRLPGFVAHQEVIFGGLGQILTLRHDSLDRRSFMPGVVLAIRKVRSLQGLVVGLEMLL